MNENDSIVSYLEIYSTVETLIDHWTNHHREGERKGINSRHEWQDAPEWAHKEAEDWVRKDGAYRLLIGSQLASQALSESLKRHENGES